jgi:hypothetical protein
MSLFLASRASLIRHSSARCTTVLKHASSSNSQDHHETSSCPLRRVTPLSHGRLSRADYCRLPRARIPAAQVDSTPVVAAGIEEDDLVYRGELLQRGINLRPKSGHARILARRAGPSRLRPHDDVFFITRGSLRPASLPISPSEESNHLAARITELSLRFLTHGLAGLTIFL